ncbi:MAG: UDP-N-acetyl-D-mannosamine dehydrogenase [Chloroflexi bacterium HGW-Chloroflexi-8]|jgi:UDP-N-acetyl-D-mannosaminuronic acid dehydrogenase|nr:MAG: UDP-N-acetyl-D-mannosamine dehydrogenase [Chloroflexi bacterium HGW-Chloroflexi-8]
MEFNTVCVIGLGYIGLPTASTFATSGLKVIGVDVNLTIIDLLQNGHVHIYEPGLGQLVEKAIQTRNLIISSRPVQADAFIIAVPTPFYGDKKADLSFVKSAAESIVPFLQKGNLVVLESTSPPLTTIDILVPILERSGLTAGSDFSVAYSPERVLPGQILRELIENARVIGGIDQASAQAGKDLYKTFVKGEIITTTATTAEMVKLMENTYRDVNIAIANEFARLADRFGVDVWEAIQIANLHPRVNILNPGPGVGGHCISVDPWFLVEAAPDITSLIYTSRIVNDSQPDFVVLKVKEILGELAGKKIAALGLSYKPDVDDLRESPAIEVVEKLCQAGALVTAFEPYKTDFMIKHVTMAKNLDETIRDADLIILLVNHTQLKRIDPFQIVDKTKARIIFDTVGGWNPEIWKNAGFATYRLGVSER